MIDSSFTVELHVGQPSVKSSQPDVKHQALKPKYVIRDNPCINSTTSEYKQYFNKKLKQTKQLPEFKQLLDYDQHSQYRIISRSHNKVNKKQFIPFYENNQKRKQEIQSNCLNLSKYRVKSAYFQNLQYKNSRNRHNFHQNNKELSTNKISKDPNPKNKPLNNVFLNIQLRQSEIIQYQNIKFQQESLNVTIDQKLNNKNAKKLTNKGTNRSKSANSITKSMYFKHSLQSNQLEKDLIKNSSLQLLKNKQNKSVNKKSEIGGDVRAKVHTFNDIKILSTKQQISKKYSKVFQKPKMLIKSIKRQKQKSDQQSYNGKQLFCKNTKTKNRIISSKARSIEQINNPYKQQNYNQFIKQATPNIPQADPQRVKLSKKIKILPQDINNLKVDPISLYETKNKISRQQFKNIPQVKAYDSSFNFSQHYIISRGQLFIKQGQEPFKNKDQIKPSESYQSILSSFSDEKKSQQFVSNSNSPIKNTYNRYQQVKSYAEQPKFSQITSIAFLQTIKQQPMHQHSRNEQIEIKQRCNQKILPNNRNQKHANENSIGKQSQQQSKSNQVVNIRKLGNSKLKSHPFYENFQAYQPNLKCKYQQDFYYDTTQIERSLNNKWEDFVQKICQRAFNVYVWQEERPYYILPSFQQSGFQIMSPCRVYSGLCQITGITKQKFQKLGKEYLKNKKNKMGSQHLFESSYYDLQRKQNMRKEIITIRLQIFLHKYTNIHTNNQYNNYNQVLNLKINTKRKQFNEKTRLHECKDRLFNACMYNQTYEFMQELNNLIRMLMIHQGNNGLKLRYNKRKCEVILQNQNSKKVRIDVDESQFKQKLKQKQIEERCQQKISGTPERQNSKAIITSNKGILNKDRLCNKLKVETTKINTQFIVYNAKHSLKYLQSHYYNRNVKTWDDQLFNCTDQQQTQKKICKQISLQYLQRVLNGKFKGFFKLQHKYFLFCLSQQLSHPQSPGINSNQRNLMFKIKLIHQLLNQDANLPILDQCEGVRMQFLIDYPSFISQIASSYYFLHSNSLIPNGTKIKALTFMILKQICKKVISDQIFGTKQEYHQEYATIQIVQNDNVQQKIKTIQCQQCTLQLQYEYQQPRESGKKYHHYIQNDFKFKELKDEHQIKFHQRDRGQELKDAAQELKKTKNKQMFLSQSSKILTYNDQSLNEYQIKINNKTQNQDICKNNQLCSNLLLKTRKSEFCKDFKAEFGQVTFRNNQITKPNINTQNLISLNSNLVIKKRNRKDTKNHDKKFYKLQAKNFNDKNRKFYANKKQIFSSNKKSNYHQQFSSFEYKFFINLCNKKVEYVKQKYVKPRQHRISGFQKHIKHKVQSHKSNQLIDFYSLKDKKINEKLMIKCSIDFVNRNSLHRSQFIIHRNLIRIVISTISLRHQHLIYPSQFQIKKLVNQINQKCNGQIKRKFMSKKIDYSQVRVYTENLQKFPTLIYSKYSINPPAYRLLYRKVVKVTTGIFLIISIVYSKQMHYCFLKIYLSWLQKTVYFNLSIERLMQITKNLRTNKKQNKNNFIKYLQEIVDFYIKRLKNTYLKKYILQINENMKIRNQKLYDMIKQQLPLSHCNLKQLTNLRPIKSKRKQKNTNNKNTEQKRLVSGQQLIMNEQLISYHVTNGLGKEFFILFSLAYQQNVIGETASQRQFSQLADRNIIKVQIFQANKFTRLKFQWNFNKIKASKNNYGQMIASNKQISNKNQFQKNILFQILKKTVNSPAVMYKQLMGRVVSCIIKDKPNKQTNLIQQLKQIFKENNQQQKGSLLFNLCQMNVKKRQYIEYQKFINMKLVTVTKQNNGKREAKVDKNIIIRQLNGEKVPYKLPKIGFQSNLPIELYNKRIMKRICKIFKNTI